MKLVGFQVSKTKGKKYDALVLDGKKIKRVPFGAVGFAQYKDTTGLGKYSHLDHNDDKRKERYLKRHAKDKDKPFSAGYYSAKYLWS